MPAHKKKDSMATRSQGLPTPEPTPPVDDDRVAAENARKKAAEEQAAKGQAAKGQAAKEQAAKEQAAKEQAAKEQAAKEQAAKEQAAKEQAAKEQAAKEQAEKRGTAKEITQEIERIQSCAADSYAEILAVDPAASEDEKQAAWVHLGCMLHPKYCNHKKAEAAFKKLAKAAEVVGVDQRFIDAVNLWDGEENILGDQSDSQSVTSRMDEDEILEPPVPVKELYKEATQPLHQLKGDPDDEASLTELKELNANIVERTRVYNAQAKEGESVTETQWVIPVGFFSPHYKIVLENYDALSKDSTDSTARNNVSVAKNLIDNCIKRNHFPTEWTVLSAEEYLKAKADEGKSDPDVNSKRMTYPWPTAEAADGSLIVGIRAQGRWGTQVCVERVEEGRIVRRLESASEVGLLEVEKYKRTAGHKVLSEGQKQWSSKDRDDFDELLWVTKSQIQRKNLAAGERLPNADCFVRFHKKGLNILALSSLNRVLGRTSANHRVKEVCQRDGIPPPWEAGHVSEYYDPSKVGKNSARRRAMKDEQAEASSEGHRKAGRSQQRYKVETDSESEAGENTKLNELEAHVAGMDAKMTAMENLLKQLLEKLSTSSQTTGK